MADVAGADQLIVRGLLVWTALAWRAARIAVNSDGHGGVARRSGSTLARSSSSNGTLSLPDCASDAKFTSISISCMAAPMANQAARGGAARAEAARAEAARAEAAPGVARSGASSGAGLSPGAGASGASARLHVCVPAVTTIAVAHRSQYAVTSRRVSNVALAKSHTAVSTNPERPSRDEAPAAARARVRGCTGLPCAVRSHSSRHHCSRIWATL